MKVVFIIDSLSIGGAEKSLLSIISSFSRKVSVKVVYFYTGHNLKESYIAAGIPLTFLCLNGKYDFIKGIKRLKRLIKSEKPDLIVSSLLRSNLIARVVSLITGVPLIGTFLSDSYNKLSLELKSGINIFKFKFFWELDKLTAGIPVKYISNSFSIAQSHVKTLGVPLTKSKVVYRGRNVPYQKWHKPNNKNCQFLTYGRLLQIKGFEELIKAFAIAKKKYPYIKLKIYGEGMHRANLEKVIFNLNLNDSIDLPGVKPNVLNQLYKADCFVFPSWYEGFSGALVEAMMAGIPIIASDIPMNLEAIENQSSALTFPVRNVEALAERMIYAIEHPDEMAALGKNAREVAIQRFDIKVIAQQYEAFLREVYQEFVLNAK